MILGNGELIDLLSSCMLMRMDHGITQAELDAMVPYQYQLFILMMRNHLKESR